MDAMPKPSLPYASKEIARGHVFWYVRRRKGPRIRIRGDFGSPEFMANYHAALDELFNGAGAPQKQPVAANGTLGWLIDRYKDSAAWSKLSAATQSQRANIYKIVIKRAGDAPLSVINAKMIRQGVEDRAKTPFAANDFLKAMRALFGWAKRAQHVEIDPTEGVKGFPHKTQGFHSWTEAGDCPFRG